ncbi:7324_t:CDS:2, partial [Gigaspora margarita]
MCLTYPYKNSVESGNNTAIDLNKNLIMTSFYVDSNEEFQTYSIVEGNNYTAVECNKNLMTSFDVDNNEEFQTYSIVKGNNQTYSIIKGNNYTTVECNENLITSFDIDDNEFQTYSVVEGNNNAAVECNKNLMTSFYVDNNEEFQTYLSESALESNDNATVECNKNLIITSSRINLAIGITTLFQNANTNNIVVSDLHILDKFRAPYTFTSEIKQHAQKKVKYAFGFEKAKRALNLALDIGCKDKFINIIDDFINRKKSSISNANNENIESLCILDPLVVKLREHPSNKCIKSLAENDSHSGTKTNISAINPGDPNLYIRNTSKTTADNLFDSSTSATQSINENAAKQKYICKTCKNPDHNSQKCV